MFNAVKRQEEFLHFFFFFDFVITRQFIKIPLLLHGLRDCNESNSGRDDFLPELLLTFRQTIMTVFISSL